MNKLKKVCLKKCIIKTPEREHLRMGPVIYIPPLHVGIKENNEWFNMVKIIIKTKSKDIDYVCVCVIIYDLTKCLFLLLEMTAGGED